jgi:hypothetical protein
MSYPFIRRMEAAILQVEARFMAQRGLPSPVLVQEIKERPATHTMREAWASEPEVLPRQKRRGTWQVDGNRGAVSFGYRRGGPAGQGRAVKLRARIA